MNHRCPHDNRRCTATDKCGPCSGTTVRDGEQLRAPLLFRDSVQNEIAALPTSQALRTGDAAIDAAKRAGQQLTDAVDHAMRQQAQRDHDLTRNGYHLSLQQFDRLGPIGG